MYSYHESMKESIKEAIHYYNLSDYADREELEEKLNDELWIDDGVTGNASGSYTCNREQAKEYVLEDGMDYLNEACNDFGVEAKEIGEHFLNEDWEWMDVTIRCYLLGQMICEVLDEMGI